MKKTMKLGKMFRSMTIDRAESNESRTIELSFSSEEPYERWFGLEILDHSPKSVRLDRLKAGGALLVDHDTRDHVGVVESVSISDRRGTASVRFGKSERAEEIYQDVLGGIRRFTSVGYWVHRMTLEEESDNGPDIYRVNDWEPLEVSIVAVPADASVGIGRDAGVETREIEVEIPEKEKTVMEEKTTPAAPPADPPVEVHVIEDRARQAERQRVRQIMEIGTKHNMTEMAETAIRNGTSIDQFRETFINELERREKDLPRAQVPAKDAQQFSLFRAVNAMVSNDWRQAGREREISDQLAKESGGNSDGVFVPIAALLPRRREQRDLTYAGTAQYITETTLMADAFIDVLRPYSAVIQAGATVMAGLVGNIAIPRLTTGTTGYWVTGDADTSDLTESTPVFDQVTLSPKTVGGLVQVTRRALIQSTPSAEAIIRADLVKAIGSAIDSAAITDNTSPKPEGILGTSGIGAVLSSGLLEWEWVVNLIREVAIDNALMGTLAFLSNNKVQAAFLRTFKASGQGGTILDPGPINGSQGSIAGFPAWFTNNVPSNLGAGNRSAVIFGNFADLLIGQWGSIELLANPYTEFPSGDVLIRAMTSCDVALRRAVSFSACQDVDTDA